MGCFPNKKKKSLCESEFKRLSEKIKVLQWEVNEMMCEREKEGRAFEREVMVFAFKEAKWKEERKKLKAEVKALKKMVEQKDETLEQMGNNVAMMGVEGKNVMEDFEVLGSGLLLEQMREKRARRDEAVEKWKKLYLAIKIELDDLIQRTHDDTLDWRREEENIVEELKREVREKNETIEALREQLAAMEREKKRNKREADILRQSLRILSK